MKKKQQQQLYIDQFFVLPCLFVLFDLFIDRAMCQFQRVVAKRRRGAFDTDDLQRFSFEC